MTAVTLKLDAIGQLTREAFLELCRANPDAKLERSAIGDLVIMAPTGGETGNQNRRITQQLGNWADTDNSGFAFDSSTMFQLPNGAYRSPDAAWIPLSIWEQLSPEERQSFPPVCPEFVIELRSPSDALKALQQKMQEYIENGVRLGWLINPQRKQVEIYRSGHPVEILNEPLRLSGEEVLPGFVLDLSRIWS
jgi:Uma2 family endonuclease